MILAFLLLKFYEEGKSPMLYQAYYFEALKVYVTGIVLFIQRNLPRSKASVDSFFWKCEVSLLTEAETAWGRDQKLARSWHQDKNVKLIDNLWNQNNENKRCWRNIPRIRQSCISPFLVQNCKQFISFTQTYILFCDVIVSLVRGPTPTPGFWYLSCTIIIILQN